MTSRPHAVPAPHRRPRAARTALAAVLAAVLLTLASVLAPAPRAAADEAVTFSDVSARDIATPVHVEEGAGGTRVVTPYYAVFLEDRLFPDGFAYEYVDAADGAYGILNVYVAQLVTADEAAAADASAGSGAGNPAYRIYCTADGASATPFAGTYATAQVSAAASDGSRYLVSVAVPYGSGFAGGADGAATAEGADAAQQQAVDMRNHVSADTATYTVAYEDGSIAVVTPWYTVTVPAGMFPDGWYYTYSDEVHDWSGDGSGAYYGRVLDVYPVGQQQAAFSVCCVRDFGVQGEVVEATVGVFDGDWAGWRIDVYRAADFSTQTLDDALAQLTPYAELVTVTDTPNADPPLL